MRDVTKIKVWHKARALTAAIYKTTAGLPMEEGFGLQSQIRRASVSVVANITEGCARGSAGDLERHLRFASGSVAEVETLLLVATDIALLPLDRTLMRDITEVRKILNGFITSVSRSRRTPKSEPKD
jgi:four helix bundle protein